MLQSRSEKLWVGAGVAAALLLAVIAYFFLISPKLSDASSLAAQNDAATTQNLSLQQTINRLRADQVNLPKYEATLQADQAALPTTNGMADFLRSMQSVGLSTQVQVTSISVGSNSGVATTAKAGGVQILPITLSATGTDARLRDFLTQLQTVQPRAVVVSQASMTGSSAGSGETLTLSLDAFVLPAAA